MTKYAVLIMILFGGMYYSNVGIFCNSDDKWGETKDKLKNTARKYILLEYLLITIKYLKQYLKINESKS